ncbi:hypothetical protein O5166_25945, partial [Escherichia coli]|nr:hypothetical protein [Escherichia coli]
GVRFEGGRLLLDQLPVPDATLVLAIKLKSTWLGRFLDPSVEFAGDRQTFERGVNGLRYLNLSGLELSGLQLRGRHCRLLGTPRLWAWTQPD